MSLALIDDLQQKLSDALAAHAPELQANADIAAQVRDSKLAQVVLGLGHVPPSIQDALAETLVQADAEFASLQPAPAEPAAQPAADTGQATPDEAAYGSETQPEAAANPQLETGVAV